MNRKGIILVASAVLSVAMTGCQNGYGWGNRCPGGVCNGPAGPGGYRSSQPAYSSSAPVSGAYADDSQYTRGSSSYAGPEPVKDDYASGPVSEGSQASYEESDPRQ